MNEFNIGDRVKSFDYELEGTVEDKLFSHKSDEWVYTVRLEDHASNNAFTVAVFGGDLKAVGAKTYHWEVFQADNNVVTAVMYEVVDGASREIDRKHGHIIHHGEIGVAQAASYAMKKIYIGMNDGKFIESEGDIYV